MTQEDTLQGPQGRARLSERAVTGLPKPSDGAFGETRPTSSLGSWCQCVTNKCVTLNVRGPSKAAFLRSGLHRVLPHMHPHMDVRVAPEVPHHRRSLDLPDIPHAIVA